MLALVANRKGNLGLRAQTAQRKLPDERPFVNLFQESRAQRIRNLKCGSNHALCQIRVHPCPSVAPSLSASKWRKISTSDKRSGTVNPSSDANHRNRVNPA